MILWYVGYTPTWGTVSSLKWDVIPHATTRVIVTFAMLNYQHIVYLHKMTTYTCRMTSLSHHAKCKTTDNE